MLISIDIDKITKLVIALIMFVIVLNLCSESSEGILYHFI